MKTMVKKVVRRVSRSYGDYGRSRPTVPGWYWVWTVSGPKVAEIRPFISNDGQTLEVYCCGCSSLIRPDISDEQIRRATKIVLWGTRCDEPVRPSCDDPMSRCVRCNGTGRVTEGRSQVRCDGCDGAGFRW